MIKVEKVENWKQCWNGKQMYFISYCCSSDNSNFGGFTAYIADENLPKVNQSFESFEALENYCRGEKKNEVQNINEVKC